MKIKYEFVNETVEVEVSDEWATVIADLDRRDYNTNADSAIKLRFGYTSEGEDFPFIQLGSGTGAGTDYGLVKKFSDGLWIGNSEPEDESGEFAAKTGYNGIFFRFSDNTAYIVNGMTMKNIYTGAAIAKFG